MRYIDRYRDFINESNLTPNGPGSQLQSMLDNNLESVIMSMSDDGYKIELEFISPINGKKFITKFNPNYDFISIEDFEKQAIICNGTEHGFVYIRFEKVIAYTEEDYKLTSDGAVKKAKDLSNEEINRHESFSNFFNTSLVKSQSSNPNSKGFKLLYLVRA